jgi:hypothetical protein
LDAFSAVTVTVTVPSSSVASSPYSLGPVSYVLPAAAPTPVATTSAASMTASGFVADIALGSDAPTHFNRGYCEAE